MALAPDNDTYKKLVYDILIKLERNEEAKKYYVQENTIKRKQDNDLYRKSEQKDIIEAPKDISFLVDAAPGTGKTYTIIQKAIYLVEENDIDGQNIIILSHTNAVVNEIKERFRKYTKENRSINRSLNNVNVRTVCSFVKYCLNLLDSQYNEDNPDKKQEHFKYEATEVGFRNASNELLKRLKSNKYKLKKLLEQLKVKYLIIDEIQDAVNEIGHIVLKFVELCKENNIPVALFGDKCQAIFDFENEETNYRLKSTEETNYRLKSIELYNKLPEETCMPQNTKFVYIEGNKRQKAEVLKYSSDLDDYRNAILNVNQEECETILNKIKNDAPENFSQNNNITDKSTHCILTHSNNRALYIASVLKKNKIPVYVKVKDSDITFEYSDWIAKIFFDNCTGSMTKDKFKQIVQKRNITDSVPKGFYGYNDNDPAGSLYEFLNIEKFGLDQDEGHYTIRDVNKLLEEIYVDKRTNSVFRPTPNNQVEVSTIHKAKGREFDCVHIEAKCCDDRLIKKKCKAGKHKSMYVALTRAKYLLDFVGFKIPSIINSQNTFYILGVRKSDNSKTKQKNYKCVLQYKVLYNDIDINSFNSSEYQEIIRTIKPNEEIILKNKENYKWAITYNNQEIGTMDNAFDNSWKRVPEKYSEKSPTKITNLYVDGVWTVFDRDDDDKIQLWNAISFCGFGDVEYD